MTIINLSEDYQNQISSIFDCMKNIVQVPKFPYVQEFKNEIYNLPDTYKQTLNEFSHILSRIVEDNGYVQVKGMPYGKDFCSLLLLSCILGEIYHDDDHQQNFINIANPMIDAKLQGNQLDKLFLHTDFAMLNDPPEATLIQCSQVDPMGAEYGKNGLASVKHIISKYYGTTELQKVLETPMPFAGLRPSDGENVLFEEPILTAIKENDYKVRYHPSRIHYGFRVRKKPPTDIELEVLHLFLEMADSVRTSLSLSEGDLLIVDNHKMLHDRESCTLKLSSAGLTSRESRIVFLKKIISS